jgi:hypothetical protein
MKPEEVAEQVVYKFIKKIYEAELKKTNKAYLLPSEIVELVNKMYIEKEESLKKRIKTAILQICKVEEYKSEQNIDELIKKIFKDANLNKNKIIQEIKIKQVDT